ncbi:MAG TPA: hypothetical protein VND65_17780 [Candidatus Binatia bacterium]|nr:hypothetical protein [Candidatus Binatia bacterium]
MPRMIDQIRASKLPSNMMQFAAKGALSVTPEENLEILVYLARNNKVFGDLARMTLAGWDEKASLAAAGNPSTSPDVLGYLIAPENVRPKLLPSLLENPSVPEGCLEKLAISAQADAIAMMLNSSRVKTFPKVLQTLRSNPYLKADDAARLKQLLGEQTAAAPPAAVAPKAAASDEDATAEIALPIVASEPAAGDESTDIPDEVVAAYLAENASEIAADGGKPFQAVGGVLELLGTDYFPVTENKDISEIGEDAKPSSEAGAASTAAARVKKPAVPGEAPRRENTLQKINGLDVKGRIQLALKGNKEERSILIRDGTKVVALAVLEAPKITDGEVEKFALQKNVLEAVLRQIPLKRRFMKNYIVVRNLVSNPRTPLDLGLGLMKHLLVQDLKNISANKEVSETVRKLALKMYKQKLDAANKK